MICLSAFLLVFLAPNAAVKYTLVKSNHETLHFDADTITSEEGVKKLMIQDEFCVFERDLLDIKHKTPIFVMDKNRRLNRIERGAFKNQEITDTILITNSEVRRIRSGTFVNLNIFELVLSNNEITRIEREAIVDLPNLKLLNLANNKIVDFYELSIKGSPATVVDLAFNRLKKIDEKRFSFMNGGESGTILLDNNEIETVEGSAFQGVALGTLNLRSNNLESLPAEMFEPDTLRRIYLQDNRLEALPESFYKLTHLGVADFSGNPLSCQTKRKLNKKKRGAVHIIYDNNC